MPEQTNWTPGLIVLGVGALFALVFLFFQWRKAKAAPAKAPGEGQANLERRAQLLIEQIKELANERHQMGDERYAAEKSRLELEAAAALRARDEARSLPARASAEASAGSKVKTASGKPPTGFSAQHPQLVGALWGGGAVLFFVVLGLVLSQ